MRGFLRYGLAALLIAVSGATLSACDDAEEVEVEEGAEREAD